MSDEQEVSEGGSQIYRHNEGKEFEPAIGDETLMEELGAHMDKAVGEAANVFHEIISHLVHIDVHIVEPRPGRDYLTLYTTGMSEKPMTVPEQEMRRKGQNPDDFRYAELMICLPAGWFGEKAPAGAMPDDPDVYWPVEMLKFLARAPHQYNTWFGDGHTIPNGDPPEPVAPGTRLAGAMLIKPVLMALEHWTAQLSDGRRVNWLQVTPLYREEFDYKLKHGADALLLQFGQQRISPIVDPHRPNVAARKRFFGLF